MLKKLTKKMFLFLLLFVLIPAISYSQPTEEEILARIESGLDWLVPLQQLNGSWTESGEPIAVTGFVLTKLCDYAIEHGYSPFDPDYEYNAEVVAGFNYIFGTIRTYGAGTGMCATPVALGASNHHEIYNAAVALMALAASKSPTEVVTVGLASGLTFLQLQDNMIEYFEWAQDDNAVAGGGWRYTPNGGSDNSHTGWVVLALRYAEVNGSTIPTVIKSKLDAYINYIQCDANGGSGYYSPCDGWTNTLKTGNLLTEMAFVGDDVNTPRVQAALTYINNNWNTSTPIPGYGDTQAMYCLLKGFESYGDPVGAPPAWFDDFTTLLFSWSASDGWPGSYWTGPIISTCWALMVLEKVAPPPVCPNDIVKNNDAGECGAIVEFEVSAHYLATITQTAGLPSGSLFPVGITNQEFEIDLDGEITYCTFTVTVIDAEPPVPDLSPLPDVVVECEVTLVPPTATDNCGIITGTTVDPLFYDVQGNYSVKWIYDDGNGNVIAQLQNVVVDDNTPPVPDIDPLPDVIGECEATVDIPTATDNCAGIVEATTSDPLVYTEQGTYVVTWTYDDGNGNIVNQVQNVVVDDVTPPVITTVLEPIKLWPPNHKYVHFSVADFVTDVWDNCADLTIGDIKIVKVTSDEPEDEIGNGDGKTLMDMVISDDCKSVDLRSEREGTDNGRVYTIHMMLDDGNGNIGTAMCKVEVPHDVNDIAIDDGPVYEVTGGCNMEKSGIIAGKPVVFEGYALSIYPNPFSRFANIQFTIPSDTKVLIKIYNIFGQEIETVLNQNHLSGTYILRYDATGLAPGNYMYRLTTSDYSITKKMILK